MRIYWTVYYRYFGRVFLLFYFCGFTLACTRARCTQLLLFSFSYYVTPSTVAGGEKQRRYYTSVRRAGKTNWQRCLQHASVPLTWKASQHHVQASRRQGCFGDGWIEGYGQGGCVTLCGRGSQGQTRLQRYHETYTVGLDSLLYLGCLIGSRFSAEDARFCFLRIAILHAVLQCTHRVLPS